MVLAGRDAFGHLPGGNLRRAARQAVDAAGTAGPLRARPAFAQEAADFLATGHGRALAVDGLKPLPEPGAHGVLVDLEQARDLFHRIAAVDFREPGIGVADPMLSAGARPSTP